MFHRLHLRPGMPLAATAVAAVLIFAPVTAFAEDAVTVFAGADAAPAPAPAAAPASAAAPVAPGAQLAVTGGDASATPLLLAAGVFPLLAGAGAVAASGMRRRH